MLDLENRVLEEIEYLDTKYNVGIHNIQAYVKHMKGQNEDSLESLKRAEELIKQEPGAQSDLRSLVTWGNYAWVYYHMGNLAEAQAYLDKVEDACKTFANPSRYRVECPEMDSEEGWALLKFSGKHNYVRAKGCFEKALEVDPENPEFCLGYAITLFRLDGFEIETRENGFSLPALRKAVRLNPEDIHVKVLLALKLQDVGQEAEGEQYIEEALRSTSSQVYVFRHAAKFYRRKGSPDKAIQLLKMVLPATPDSAFLHHQIGLCYRSQVLEAKKRQTNWQDGENENRIKLAMYHLEYAVKQKPVFDLAYIHLADMRFQRNTLDVENVSLLGFIYKLKGEMAKALQYYERALKLAADGGGELLRGVVSKCEDNQPF
ncbi:interferon-induced protein with tetratricopeptide repeats 1-like [Rhynchocyon petersi]